MNALGRAFRVLLVLWAGSLWCTLLWVAPVLFHTLPDRALAGTVAGRFFAIEAWLGLGTAALALLLPVRSRFGWGYLAALTLALMQWGLRPGMAIARAQGAAFGVGFAAWHVAAALLYGLACLALALLIWKEELR